MILRTVDNNNFEYLHLRRLLYIVSNIDSDVESVVCNRYTGILHVIFGHFMIWTDFYGRCGKCARFDTWSDPSGLAEFLKRHVHAQD